MSPRAGSAQDNTADIRSWLEAAILSANAGLSATSPSDAKEVAGMEKRPSTRGEVGEPPMATVSSERKSKTSSVVGVESTTASYQRKLVTVRRVASVTTIKDTYQLLAVDGWKVLAKEREEERFEAGEYVLFLEPDAFLPARSRFENLFAKVGNPITFEGEVGYRVGTWAIRAGGKEVVSQGHVFHLSDFPDIDAKVGDLHWRNMEMSEQEFTDMIREIDFSRDLGVRKWESFPESGSHASPVIESPACDTRNSDAEYHTGFETEDDNARIPGHANGKTKAQSDDAQIAKYSDGFPTSNPKPPSFIIKADMERVQNCPNLFIKPKYKRFIFQESVKLDGATMTVYFVRHDAGIDLPRLPPLNPSNEHTFLKYAVHPNGRLGVCTRTRDLLPHLLPCETGAREAPAASSASAHTHSYWATAIAEGLHRILPSLGRSVAVQAELVGATVQGNPYAYPQTPGGPEHELFVFSITDLSPSSWAATTSATTRSSTRMHPRKVETFCRRHGLPHVPVTGYHTLHSVARGHETLLARAELRRGEGLVYKNCADGRWFKVLSTRWIRIKGDERHAREQAGNGNGNSGNSNGNNNKKKKKNGRVDAVSALGDKEGSRFPRCWLAPREVVDEILDIRDNLDEWVKKDEGVRKWVEWMNRGCRGDWPDFGMFAKGRSGGSGGGGGDSGPEEDDGTRETNANGAIKVEDAGSCCGQAEMDGKAAETNSIDEATASTAAEPKEDENAQQDGKDGRQTAGFGVSETKRDQLVSWLGVEGFGL
ncbi:uncharacterized protein P884DRAFT_300004 [Thermothelomyces heterothallicus CBS 202.75]|uniref:uncharacterized protein n=1 Tax=Thermothelomyces heterothallicus CBS 202.75 TaxID=1149848 RepID=UPI003743FB3C